MDVLDLEAYSPKQQNIIAKNKQLHQLAMENRNRFGSSMAFLSGFGAGGEPIDMERFVNVYPYSETWHQLAFGTTSGYWSRRTNKKMKQKPTGAQSVDYL